LMISLTNLRDLLCSQRLIFNINIINSRLEQVTYPRLMSSLGMVCMGIQACHLG
jgi:hypothetical protein